MLENTFVPKAIVDKCIEAFDNANSTRIGNIEELVESGQAVRYKYGDQTKIDAGNFLGSTRDENRNLICYKANKYYHSLVCASTGLGKTQTYIIPSLLNLSGKESAVVVGPKGEEARFAYNYLESVYGKENVEILNFSNPSCTGVYYNPLYVYAERYVKSFDLPKEKRIEEQNVLFSDLQKLIASSFPIVTDDPSWSIGANGLIEAIIIGLIQDCSLEYLKSSPIYNERGIRKKLTPQEVNFKKVEEVFNEFSWTTDGGAFGDKNFFSERKDKYARKKAQTALGATSAGTRSSYLSVASTALNNFLNNKVVQVSKYNTLNFSSYQERPKVLFVIYDMNDDVVKTWVNDLIKNFLNYLNEQAFSGSSGTLKIKTLFFIDEFDSLTPSRTYTNLLATGRSAGLYLNLCIQSTSQLKRAYKDDYQTIIENTNVNYFLGSNSPETVREHMDNFGTVEQPDSEQLHYGRIVMKSKPRVSFDQLMFKMKPGDCYIKTLYNLPVFIKMNFYYNTPEYKKYGTFDPLSIKAPKIIDEKPIQKEIPENKPNFVKASDFMKKEQDDFKQRMEKARLELERRKQEILRKMKDQLDESDDEEDDY